MNPWIELLLALVQGLTEPLPISSSGHLVIAQSWFGVGETSLAFEAFVNLGSVLGVMVYYRTFLLQLLQEAVRGVRERHLNEAIQFILQVGVASIPAGLVGVLFASQIAAVFSTVRAVGLMLLVTGVLLTIVSKVMTEKTKAVSNLDAGVVGVAQAFALIPGLSRSGLTTMAALLRGVDFKTALRFSMMMYLPISLAAGAWSIVQSTEMLSLSAHSFLSLAIAGLATYAVIGLYTRLVEQRRLMWFAYYCLLAGLLVVVIG
jgi:undecaprenyl-diphosphatase